jgi:hypothetical protein
MGSSIARLVVILTLASAGCSWIVVKPPPPPPRGDPTEHWPPDGPGVRCTSSLLPPLFDSMVATLATVGAVYFVAAGDDTARVLGPLVEVPLAVTFGLSAYKGWRVTHRCREMKRWYALGMQ